MDQKLKFQTKMFKLFSTSMLLSVAIILMPGCSFTHAGTRVITDSHTDRPSESRRIPLINRRPLSQNAEKELTFSPNGMAIVFSVDKKGNIQAFRPQGAKVLRGVKLPLHAEEIEAFNGLSLIQTKNPKFCWRTAGMLKCITW